MAFPNLAGQSEGKCISLVSGEQELGLSKGILERQQELLCVPPCQCWNDSTAKHSENLGSPGSGVRWKVQLLSLGFQVRTGRILVWVIKQNLQVITEIQE